jgi:hypothetical protein
MAARTAAPADGAAALVSAQRQEEEPMQEMPVQELAVQRQGE